MLLTFVINCYKFEAFKVNYNAKLNKTLYSGHVYLFSPNCQKYLFNHFTPKLPTDAKLDAARKRLKESSVCYYSCFGIKHPFFPSQKERKLSKAHNGASCISRKQ